MSAKKGAGYFVDDEAELSGEDSGDEEEVGSGTASPTAGTDVSEEESGGASSLDNNPGFYRALGTLDQNSFVSQGRKGTKGRGSQKKTLHFYQ